MKPGPKTGSCSLQGAADPVYYAVTSLHRESNRRCSALCCPLPWALQSLVHATVWANAGNASGPSQGNHRERQTENSW